MQEASSSETIIASKHHDPFPENSIKVFYKGENASGLSFNGNRQLSMNCVACQRGLYRNQIGDKFAQRLLGHKSDSMAARYRDSRGREWDKVKSTNDFYF